MVSLVELGKLVKKFAMDGFSVIIADTSDSDVPKLKKDTEDVTVTIVPDLVDKYLNLGYDLGVAKVMAMVSVELAATAIIGIIANPPEVGQEPTVSDELADLIADVENDKRDNS